jgi:rubrerythrin
MRDVTAGHGVSRVTGRDGDKRCPICGSGAFVESMGVGVCAVCRRRTSRRYVSRRTCGHRWALVALMHVGDCYKRHERCPACGEERFVEEEQR